MRTDVFCVAGLFLVSVLSALCTAQAPLPGRDMSTVANAIQRDFDSVDEIQTIGMSDDAGGRFDFVVIGSSRHGSEGGWRVEVVSIDQHRLRKRWDSEDYAKEPEFDSSGIKSIKVRAREYDYDLIIEGCSLHLCHDGIHGFLVFSAKQEKTYKAKVVTRGLDTSATTNPRYDVTFSAEISSEAKNVLQDQICQSSALSNKHGLPFECKE